MEVKQKLKEFVKDNKDKLIAGGCVIAGAVAGAVGLHLLQTKVGLPYKVTVGSDNKDFAAALHQMFNWGEGKRFDNARIGWALSNADVRKAFDEFVNDDPDKYMYDLLIEKIDKSRV